MNQLLKSGEVDFFPPGLFKNIINEVKKSCLEVDIVVDEQFVSVIVKLLSLDPGLHLDGKMDRRSLGSFVRKCVDIVIGKMEILWYEKFFSSKIKTMYNNRSIQRIVSHPKHANVFCGAYNQS